MENYRDWELGEYIESQYLQNKFLAITAEGITRLHFMTIETFNNNVWNWFEKRL